MKPNEIAAILLKHPDAKVKCMESCFRAQHGEQYGEIREVSYNAVTNTIYIYYY